MYCSVLPVQWSALNFQLWRGNFKLLFPGRAHSANQSWASVAENGSISLHWRSEAASQHNLAPILVWIKEEVWWQDGHPVVTTMPNSWYQPYCTSDPTQGSSQKKEIADYYLTSFTARWWVWAPHIRIQNKKPHNEMEHWYWPIWGAPF